MAYSAEVMKRARARLAREKADRDSLNSQRQAQAYQQVPRLREIDMQLQQIMVAAAQAAFTQGSNGVEYMEKAKQTSLALQKERSHLVAQHFEEGWLDERPVCDKCGGEGYIGSTMCTCLQELCRQEQRKELSLLSGGSESFDEFRLDYYSQQTDKKYGVSPRAVMERNFRTCLRYAREFGSNGENLLFVGGTGLGKTFLSACIAAEVVDRGYSVAYETASHLFSKLEQAKFNPNEENLREAARLKACDLLIVDDLGTEMPSQFVTAALYNLLNDRILEGKPMIVSTNLNIDEAAKRYSPQIASRLQGNFTLLPFLGEDIRVMKNRGIRI